MNLFICRWMYIRDDNVEHLNRISRSEYIVDMSKDGFGYPKYPIFVSVLLLI